MEGPWRHQLFLLKTRATYVCAAVGSVFSKGHGISRGISASAPSREKEKMT